MLLPRSQGAYLQRRGRPRLERDFTCRKWEPPHGAKCLLPRASPPGRGTALTEGDPPRGATCLLPRDFASWKGTSLTEGIDLAVRNASCVGAASLEGDLPR